MTDFCGGPLKNRATSVVQKFITDLAVLTSKCRERVEAFDGAKEHARKYENYFAQAYQQTQVEANVAEFRKYLSHYQSSWVPGGSLDPDVLMAKLLELECGELQFKDQLSTLLKEWKTDQALAQIGKQADASALDPLATGYAKLENTVYETCSFINRFREFAEERHQRSTLTQMGLFWQAFLQSYGELAMRLERLRIELQRESFLVYEQPPYIVRLSSGKTSTKEATEANASEESADEKFCDPAANEQEETTDTKSSPSKSRGQTSKENGGSSGTKKGAKDQQEKRVIFDLRVRLMVGDKGVVSGNTKVCAYLLTDQQCRELTNKQLTPYDNPLTILAEIGPPITAAATNGKGYSGKRKIAKGRRRSCTAGALFFTAGHLTPSEASLNYDSSLEHFEAFFQKMKVNEKDRNPEADAQSRFYRILFVTKLKDRQANEFFIWCLSLPFPIVVNATRQERATSAKIFCHLALIGFSDPMIDCNRFTYSTQIRSPSSPPMQCTSTGSASSEQRSMKWKDFFDLLCWWWLKQTGTDPEMGSLRPHEPYLASKLQVNMANPEAILSLDEVTRKMNGLEFSFWDWLFLIADYVKKKENKPFWDNGFIVGFVSKEQVNAYLATIQGEPVMLIRFSDSILGSVVISYGMKGKETQHILLRPKDELKKYPLTYFIKNSKQLVSINYVVTNVAVPNAFKLKSEFLQLVKKTEQQPNDDSEVRKRGYTKPRLEFDWLELPASVDFAQAAGPGSVEHDEQSLESTVSLEELEELLHIDGFDNNVESYRFDQLSADPNNFSTALVGNQPAGQLEQVLPAQEGAYYEQPLWRGSTYTGATGVTSAVGSVPMT